MRFVRDPLAPISGRYWIETRPAMLRDPPPVDSPDDSFEHWTTDRGEYKSLRLPVLEDMVIVQCPKYAYESVKHLLDGFDPMDNDLLRPVFIRLFRDSAGAAQWWENHGERFLAGSIASTNEQRLTLFGQTPGAMQRFAEWVSYLADHPDHDGTAALITDEDGSVHVVVTR